MTTQNLQKNPKQKNWKQHRNMGPIIYLGAGILIGGILGPNCRGCKGDSTYNNPDAGVNDYASAYDAGVAEISKCGIWYGPVYVGGLEQELEQCGNKLNECREENAELSKRPESCQKYKPIACPSVKPFPAYRRE